MTTIYLASRWSFKPILKSVWRPGLLAHGFEVNSRWLDEQEEKADEQLSIDEKRYFGQRDIDDIIDADLFVQFNYAEHYENDRTCGRHHELGMAIVLHKPIIIVGENRSVFHGFARITIPGHMVRDYGDNYAISMLAESVRVVAKHGT